MAFRRGMISTTIAMGIALTLSVPAIAAAQARGQGGAQPQAGQAQARGQGGGAAGGGQRGGRGGAQNYTPEPGAKDLRSVLFNWEWHLGMLRGDQERDLIASLEYQGKGTVQVDGQPCNVTKYRISTNYQTSGQRIQYTCTRPNGQTYSNVEVLSGGYAWNEDIPGAELIKGKGKATAMPATVQERMIRLWASPQGAPKAAIAGISDPPQQGGRPGVIVPANVSNAGKTSVVWENGKPVVTFPIPGVPDAIATATLDAKFMAERVVVKQGANTTEFIYSDYKDWNNKLNPAEALVAGKMTERRNGTVVRDISTIETETGQMYVVMPVPASVKAAMTPTNQPPKWTQDFGQVTPQTAAAQVPTPRLPDGKPDMTGNWNAVAMGPPGGGNRRCGPTQVGCTGPGDNFIVDYEWISPSRYGPSRPVYKPEFWDKVQNLDQWTNKYDPVMTCQPLGLPRQGTPSRIIHTPKDIIFFYRQYADYGGGNTEFRDIPTDGRQRDATRAREATYFGYSIGKWEGDTLVIDSTSFVDSTWLGRGGLFHSANMHIIERLTRVGNEIRYDMTIEDPDVFVEPWVMPTRILRAGAGDPTIVPERAYCEVYETEDIATQLRH